MANLKEQEKWEDGVYQIEENDPVLGGENGITNKPIKQLANRTLWLKKALELFGKKSAPKDLTANSTSTADESGHSHKLPVGSTTQKGIWQATSDTSVDSDGLVLTAKAGKKLAQMIAVVQLALGNYIPLNKRSSAVNSNSNDTVATSAAVKSANDNANARVAKSGDTMTGGLSIKQGDYSGISLYNNDGYHLRLEGNSHANGIMLTAVYRKPNGDNMAVAFLPKRDGTIAYIDQVVNKTGDTMTGNLTVPNLIVNEPTNNNNFVQIGDDTKLIDVDMGHTVGLQATDNANDAYIAYGTTKKRFGFDGANFKADSGIAAQWYQADAKGHGSFGAQWRDKTAPYVINNPNANGSNIYFPFLKGFNSNGDLYGTAFSIGYMTPGAINQFGSGVIHLIEDNGSEKYWWFDRDGKLRGDDFECQGKRLSKSHQTDYAYVETTAAIWGGLKINRNGDHMLIESNDRGGFSFVRRNKDGSNVYVLSAPAKNGTLATLEDFGGNLSGNGWTRLPNGLILQWGTANGGWVNFPIAFPNACFSVVGTQGQGSDYEPYVIYNISNTRFYHKGRVEHEANGAHWMAIGN